MNLRDLLEPDSMVPEEYTVTQPSILESIGKTGIRRATIIDDYAYTVTCRQDRCPAQIIERPDGNSYRFLTEKECWRLQGFTDDDFEAAKAVNPSKKGKKNKTLYQQAGNSMPVNVLESIFAELLDSGLLEREEHGIYPM